MTRFVPGSDNFVQDHVSAYMGTGGFVGHFLHLEAYGGVRPNTTLILKTIGRKSGEARFVPLIYDNVGADYVIIGSTSGGPRHPAWYLNLQEDPSVEFQVADKSFRGMWRILGGSEREDAWDRMAAYFPPYADYKTRTTRVIPVIALTPVERTPSLRGRGMHPLTGERRMRRSPL